MVWLRRELCYRQIRIETRKAEKACRKILDAVDVTNPSTVAHDDVTTINALVDKLYECGDVIIALWKAQEWHHATVLKVHNNGTYSVKYNDGVIEKCVVCDHMQPVPSKWSENRIRRHCRMLGVDLRVRNTMRKMKFSIMNVWKNKQNELKSKKI